MKWRFWAIDPIELSLEVGRNLVPGGDEWIYGLVFEASIGRRVELVAEVHGEKPARSAAELIVNGGARRKITRNLSLMVAVGSAVRGMAADKPRLLVHAGGGSASSAARF